MFAWPARTAASGLPAGIQERIEALLGSLSLGELDAAAPDAVREMLAGGGMDLWNNPAALVGQWLQTALNQAVVWVGVLMVLLGAVAILRRLSPGRDPQVFSWAAGVAVCVAAAGICLGLMNQTVQGIAQTESLAGQGTAAIALCLAAAGRMRTAAAGGTVAGFLAGSGLRVVAQGLCALCVGQVILAAAYGIGHHPLVLRLARQMGAVARVGLGLVCGMFLIVMTLLLLPAGSSDGIALQAAKLAAGSVPLIGNVASGALGSLLGGGHLLARAVGSGLCLLLVFAAAQPLLSAACSAAGMGLVGALAGTWMNDEAEEALSCMAKGVSTCVLCAAGAVGMTVTLLLGLGALG